MKYGRHRQRVAVGTKVQVGACAALSAPMLQQHGILRPNVQLRAVSSWSHGGGSAFAAIQDEVRADRFLRHFRRRSPRRKPPPLPTAVPRV